MSERPDPDTLDTQNMGTVFFLRLLEAAVMQSSSDLTTRGILLEPAALSVASTASTVLVSLSCEVESILVMTTKNGTSNATAIPRCSLIYILDLDLVG